MRRFVTRDLADYAGMTLIVGSALYVAKLAVLDGLRDDALVIPLLVGLVLASFLLSVNERDAVRTMKPENVVGINRSADRDGPIRPS